MKGSFNPQGGLDPQVRIPALESPISVLFPTLKPSPDDCFWAWGFIWMLEIQIQVPVMVQETLDHEHLLHLALYLKSDFTFISFIIIYSHEQSYTMKSLSTGSWVANSVRIMLCLSCLLWIAACLPRVFFRESHNESAQLISCSFCLALFYFF